MAGGQAQIDQETKSTFEQLRHNVMQARAAVSKVWPQRIDGSCACQTRCGVYALASCVYPMDC